MLFVDFGGEVAGCAGRGGGGRIDVGGPGVGLVMSLLRSAAQGV